MKQYVNKARNLVSRNASDILLVGGVASILGGGILAIRQTPKAIKLLEQNKNKTKLDKVKSITPLYVPSVLLTGIGITQIVCSRNITNNKIAAVATAYTVSETAFKTYREKVKDIVEPEKYEEIKKEVAREKLKRDPILNKEVLIQPNSDVLIYDSISGRYFKGNMNNVDYAVNIINKRLRNDMSIQLNDFYNEIDIPPIKIGCEVGWVIDKMDLELHVTSSIAENGEPCLVIDYDVVPL